MSKFDRSLQVLLRDFGYEVKGDVIISKGIRGFTSDRIWGRCRSLFDAAEMLRPIIKEQEFSERLEKISREGSVVGKQS